MPFPMDSRHRSEPNTVYYTIVLFIVIIIKSHLVRPSEKKLMWKVKDLEIRYLLTWKLFYPMFAQIVKLAAEKYPKKAVCCTKFIIGHWATKLAMDRRVFCCLGGNFYSEICALKFDIKFLPLHRPGIRI